MSIARTGEGQVLDAPEDKRALVTQYGEPAADLIVQIRGSQEVRFLESHDPLRPDHHAVVDLVETVTGEMGRSLKHPSFSSGDDMERFDALGRLPSGELSDTTATLVGSLCLGDVEHDITYVGGKWMIGVGEVERGVFRFTRRSPDRLLVDPYQPTGHVALTQPLSAVSARQSKDAFIDTERTIGVASTRISGAALLQNVRPRRSNIDDFLHGTAGAERPRAYGTIVPEPHTEDRSSNMVIAGYRPDLGRQVLMQHAQLITSAANHVPDRAAFHLARLRRLGVHPERDGRAPHSHVSTMILELCLNGQPHIARRVAETYLGFGRDNNDGTWLADRSSRWWRDISVAYERCGDSDNGGEARSLAIGASAVVLARTTDERLIREHRRRIEGFKYPRGQELWTPPPR